MAIGLVRCAVTGGVLIGSAKRLILAIATVHCSGDVSVSRSLAVVLISSDFAAVHCLSGRAVGGDGRDGRFWLDVGLALTGLWRSWPARMAAVGAGIGIGVLRGAFPGPLPVIRVLWGLVRRGAGGTWCVAFFSCRGAVST